MKHFFQSVKDSIYSPAFYVGLRTQKLSYSIKYFYKLAVILALITVIHFAAATLPGLQSFFTDAGSKIISHYPDTLELKIVKGEAFVNQPEPYYLPLPAEIKPDVERDMPGIDNLVVVDTTQSYTPEQFDRYRTLVWVTKTHLAVRDKGGKVSLNPLQGVGDVTLNKAFVESTLQKLSPLIKSIPFAILFFVFIGMIFGISNKLVYLLVAGLAVFLYFKVRKEAVSYRASYQIALHALTFPLVLTFLVQLLFPAFAVPFLTSFLLALVVYLNFSKVSVIAPTPPPGDSAAQS